VRRSASASSKRKVFEWLQEKLDAAEAGEFSFETLKNYRGYMKNYFLPAFEKMDVREIDDAKLDEFKQSLRQVMGIKTRRNILNALHALGLDLTAHEFGRHSFITQLMQTPGVTPADAQALARHADIRSTLRYCHTDFTRLKDITNRRGNIPQNTTQE
jgi:site-specific recombinase XerD